MFFRNTLLLASLLLSVSLACSSAAQAGKFKVVTTFTIIADMARHVAGDDADVESITMPGAEIHEYQPTPRDLMRAQGAKLILWNGLGLERWFEKFFDNISDVPSVVVSNGVVPLGITQGPYSGKPNPHAWMSPGDGLIYIDNICDALVTYDPDNAENYRKNAAQYKQEIRDAIAPIKAKLAALPDDQRFLVTSEGAFSYLARDLALKELYLWPINADQQGTPQQVKKLIDAVRMHHIQVVFSESTISSAPAKQVARETGARYGGVLYVDSLSDQDGPVPSYLDLLKVTSTTIAQGLTQGARLEHTLGLEKQKAPSGSDIDGSNSEKQDGAQRSVE